MAGKVKSFFHSKRRRVRHKAEMHNITHGFSWLRKRPNGSYVLRGTDRKWRRKG